jgi:hypothetical protein
MLWCLTDLTPGRTHLNVHVLDATILRRAHLCGSAKQLGLESVIQGHIPSGDMPTGSCPFGDPNHGVWLMLYLLTISHLSVFFLVLSEITIR